MNKVWQLKAFAVLATCYTAMGTGDIAYARAPENFEWLMVVLAIIILDGGFWLLDYLLPKAQSMTHRIITSGALIFWWMLMAVSNIASALKNLSLTDFAASDWGLVAGYILALIALAFLVYYISIRYTDPEMREALARMEHEMDKTAKKLEYRKNVYQKLVPRLARAELIAEMKQDYEDEHGEPPPEWYIKILESNGFDEEPDSGSNHREKEESPKVLAGLRQKNQQDQP